MGIGTQPLHQGRKHGYRSTHTRRYIGSLRPQEGPVPDVRQTRPPQADVHSHRPHRRLQDRRLPGDHLRRVRRLVRLLHDLPQFPRGGLPRALYDNKVRDLVLDRILKDGMSIERTLESLSREFLLDLSTGFVSDVLYDHAKPLDMAAHRRTVLALFSGTLCVDELHLGRFTLLLATDPLSDRPVAFALVAANDQGHMRRFLGNLKNWALDPEVVVTDGSNLYPTVRAELWPDADHQLCVFHIIKDINQLTLDAVRRMRTAMSRRGKAGRKKKRGRKGAKSKAAARRGMTVKEKAHFVFQRRHLIVKRRENLTEAERDDLTRMLEYLP